MNATLPILDYRDAILTAVAAHPVVIITAETGAGKSTQVPQFLHGAGYDVVVTQPRRLAARTVSTRVAEEMGVELGTSVGFRTAEERMDSPQTQVLFCTDGLQLVRELTGRGKAQQVLIIDEVHEWNRNIETLVAWSKRQLSLGRASKLVLMSATIEAGRLAAYFGGAPVISVAGRLFPVEQTFVPLGYDEDSCSVVARAALDLASAGRNTLVFVPGKAEISSVMEQLEAAAAGIAEVLPLHGGLTPDQQRLVFRRYNRPKIIVSTNVAQTSVTIDDIDAVVDAGLERRVEVRDSVEGLYLGDISQADCRQRMGRAGRTKPGLYVLCAQRPIEARDEFPQPEIERSRLDQLVLRLAEIGLDAAELEFFHQPDLAEIVRSKEALQRLGALDDDGKVTETGRAMSRLPVDVHHARMIVEAQRRGVASEVLSIVACLEAGGIRGKGRREDGILLPPQWRQLTEEDASDLLAELDLFRLAGKMNRKEMMAHDMLAKNYAKAKELRARLARELRVSGSCDEAGSREEILKACVSGMIDHLYRHGLTRDYVGPQAGDLRQLDNQSVVQRAEWVVGVPFDLELKNRHQELYTLNLLTFVTRVDPAWLIEVAPQLASSQPEGFEYSTEVGEIVFVTAQFFAGRKVGAAFSPAEPGPEAQKALATALAKGSVPHEHQAHNARIREELLTLSLRHGGRVEYPAPSALAEIYLKRLGDVCLAAGLEGANLKLELSDFVPADLLEGAPSLAPETVEINGISCEVIYTPSTWSLVPAATVRVPAAHVRRLTSLPLLPNGARTRKVEALDGDGNVVARGYSLLDLREVLERQEADRRKEVLRQECQAEIEALQHRCGALEAEGRETATLRDLLRSCNTTLARAASSWYGVSLGDVVALLRRAEAEAERLSGDALEVLLADLLAGRTRHPHHEENGRMLEKLQILAIRSGGYVEVLSRAQLEQHYRTRLEGVRSVRELSGRDLRLKLEDYAPREILDELDLAPEAVELTGRKGSSQYPVRYGYEERDGAQIPIGTIQVPLSVYERNAAEHGKPSKLPLLPHGIRLIIEVTDGGKVVARGEDGEELQTRLKKVKKGQRRGKTAPNTDEFGFARRGPVVAEVPPPWFKGRVR